MTEENTAAPAKTAKILSAGINAIIFILMFLLLAVFTIGIALQISPELKNKLVMELGTLDREVPSGFMMVSGYLGTIIIIAAYLYVALIMRKIVQTTLKGNPFVEANISRLRTTWVVIATTELFKMFLYGYIKQPTSGEGGGRFSFELDLTVWFLVFVIATMAEAFRIGLELKRDQELTV